MRVRKFVSRGCAKDGASAFIMRMTALRHKRSINPPQGCHLHPRCPHASAGCSAVEPALAEITPGHWVACHLHTTFALQNVDCTTGRLSAPSAFLANVRF